MLAMVADARALIRLGLIQLLKDVAPEATVRETESAGALLDALSGASPDLIFVGLELDDLVVPDGLEAILNRAGGSRLVVVSEREDPRLVEQCFSVGVTGYMPTGLRREVATNALRLVMAGDKYLPAALLRPQGMSGVREDVRPLDGSIASAARSLTRRQQEVLRLLAAGRSNKEIAQTLGLAEGTVKIHVSAILKALGVGNRTEATVRALNAG